MKNYRNTSQTVMLSILMSLLRKSPTLLLRKEESRQDFLYSQFQYSDTNLMVDHIKL